MIKIFQKRHVLIVIMVILVVVVAGLVISNLPRDRSPEDVDAPVRDVDLALQAFEYTETREGRRHWTIEGDSAGYRQDSGEALIENLRVFFFDESGEEAQVTLTAKHGRILVEARELRVWDDVVIETDEGYTLLTQSLEYQDEGQQASTDEPVRILSEAYDIRGRGMRMDVASRTVRLLSDVNATLSAAADGQ
jgi:LPS export ABC transporter protein LptC